MTLFFQHVLKKLCYQFIYLILVPPPTQQLKQPLNDIYPSIYNLAFYIFIINIHT